jgi:hypothetical protein
MLLLGLIIASDIYFGNPDSDWYAEWLGGRCLAYYSDLRTPPPLILWQPPLCGT